MNPTTRKYPRTLNEAFGPYSDGIEPIERGFDWQDVVVMVGCLAAAVALLIIFFTE